MNSREMIGTGYDEARNKPDQAFIAERALRVEHHQMYGIGPFYEAEWIPFMREQTAIALGAKSE